MIGKTLSHFVIRDRIGEGGMGIVYKAEDVQLQREIALKVLRPEFVQDLERRARFVLLERVGGGLHVLIRQACALCDRSQNQGGVVHLSGERQCFLQPASGGTLVSLRNVQPGENDQRGNDLVSAGAFPGHCKSLLIQAVLAQGLLGFQQWTP